MSDADRRARGLAGVRAGDGLQGPASRRDPFLDVTLDHLFADLWSRPGLSVRDRRLVTLTVLMCFGHEAT